MQVLVSSTSTTIRRPSIFSSMEIHTPSSNTRTRPRPNITAATATWGFSRLRPTPSSTTIRVGPPHSELLQCPWRLTSGPLRLPGLTDIMEVSSANQSMHLLSFQLLIEYLCRWMWVLLLLWILVRRLSPDHVLQLQHWVLEHVLPDRVQQLLLRWGWWGWILHGGRFMLRWRSLLWILRGWGRWWWWILWKVIPLIISLSACWFIPSLWKY